MNKVRASAWAVSLCLHSLVLAWMVHSSLTGGAGYSTGENSSDSDSSISVSFSAEAPAQSAVPEPELLPPALPELTIAPPAPELIVTRAAAEFSVEAPPPQGIAIDPTAEKSAAARAPKQTRGGRKGNGGYGTGQGRGRGSYAPPRYIHSPAPEYPLEAKRERRQGMVLLWVQVSKEGRPVHISVKRSSGFQMLDEAAIRTVRKWLFEPARLNQQAVASAVEVPVRFRLAG